MDRRINYIPDFFCSFFKLHLIGALILSSHLLSGQINVTTLGVQLKPMVPSKFFGSGNEDVIEEDLSISTQPKLGWNFGMVVRRGLTNMWSLETGICLVQRNFTMAFDYPGLNKKQELSFRYICYEIPLQGIIFVKLSDQLYMNASAGVSIDIYPSNVESSTSVKVDSINYDFYQKTWRTKWIQVALLANYGFEWRTKESGYFYFGASYHRPFSQIGLTRVVLERNTEPTRVSVILRGNYLTADLRYFFNEKPERKKPKS